MDQNCKDDVKKGLNSSAKNVRIEVIEQIAQNQWKDVVADLRNLLLEEKDHDVRVMILNALSLLDAENVLVEIDSPPVIHFLKEHYWEVLANHSKDIFHPIYTRVIADPRIVSYVEKAETDRARRMWINLYAESKERAVLKAIIQNFVVRKDPDLYRLIHQTYRDWAKSGVCNDCHDVTFTLGHEALPLLRVYFHSRQVSQEKSFLVKRIGALRDPFWLTLLFELLIDPHYQEERQSNPFCEQLQMAFVELKDEAVSQLLPYLQSEDPVVVNIVAHTLGRIGNPDHIPLLIEQLLKGNVFVYKVLRDTYRQNIADELGQVLIDPAMPETVRLEAHEALNEIRSPEAVAILRETRLFPIRRKLTDDNSKRWELTEKDVYTLLSKRAENFFDTLSQVGAFKRVISEDEFTTRARPYLTELVDTFLYSAENASKAKEQLERLCFSTLPEHLQMLFQDDILSGANELFELLLHQAEILYQNLSRAGAFGRSISQAEFTERVRRILPELIDLTDNMRLEYCFLDFPSTLLMSEFEDVVPILNFPYDVDFGWFFRDAKKAFDQVHIRLEWALEPEQKRLQFSIGNRNWVVNDVSSLNEEFTLGFLEIFPEIDPHLMSLGYEWMDISPGNGVLLLLPIGGKQHLRPLNYAEDDLRSQLIQCRLTDHVFKSLPEAVQLG